jgi:hypothetical protein
MVAYTDQQKYLCIANHSITDNILTENKKSMLAPYIR